MSLTDQIWLEIAKAEFPNLKNRKSVEKVATRCYKIYHKHVKEIIDSTEKLVSNDRKLRSGRTLKSSIIKNEGKPNNNGDTVNPENINLRQRSTTSMRTNTGPIENGIENSTKSPFNEISVSNNECFEGANKNVVQPSNSSEHYFGEVNNGTLSDNVNCWDDHGQTIPILDDMNATYNMECFGQSRSVFEKSIDKALESKNITIEKDSEQESIHPEKKETLHPKELESMKSKKNIEKLPNLSETDEIWLEIVKADCTDSRGLGFIGKVATKCHKFFNKRTKETSDNTHTLTSNDRKLTSLKKSTIQNDDKLNTDSDTMNVENVSSIKHSSFAMRGEKGHKRNINQKRSESALAQFSDRNHGCSEELDEKVLNNVNQSSDPPGNFLDEVNEPALLDNIHCQDSVGQTISTSDVVNAAYTTEGCCQPGSTFEKTINPSFHPNDADFENPSEVLDLSTKNLPSENFAILDLSMKHSTKESTAINKNYSKFDETENMILETQNLTKSFGKSS